MNPRHINTTVRTLVSIVIVGAFVSLWTWKMWHNEPINPITFAVVILFAIAAGYSIFGKRVMNDAVETYDRLRGKDGDSDE